MFKDYYEYYHFILSKFNPLQSIEIKKLLNDALDAYNDKESHSFISGLRKIADYLDAIGKTSEATTTRNWLLLIQYNSKHSNNK